MMYHKLLRRMLGPHCFSMQLSALHHGIHMHHVFQVIAELRYDLPATYRFHKQKSVDIEASFMLLPCLAVETDQLCHPSSCVISATAVPQCAASCSHALQRESINHSAAC